MGTFSVTATLANPQVLERRSAVELLVDTGALFSFVPRRILAELGVSTTRRERFTTVSGEIISREIGRALFILDGKEEVTPVVFGEGGDLPVLGALTLEALGFVVDPVAKKLTPRPTLPAA